MAGRASLDEQSNALDWESALYGLHTLDVVSLLFNAVLSDGEFGSLTEHYYDQYRAEVARVGGCCAKGSPLGPPSRKLHANDCEAVSILHEQGSARHAAADELRWAEYNELAPCGHAEQSVEKSLKDALDSNTSGSIRRLYGESGLSWWPVVLYLPARLVFAFLAQTITAALFFSLGYESPWESAAAWWPVYSTLTDLLCLGTLVLLLRRESLRIGDLFGVSNWRSAARQLLWTPLVLLAVAPGAVAANLITVAFYGSELPPMISIVNLPPVGVLYTISVWPVLWVFTEELVYLGFLLPRLEALTRKTWIAVTIVIVFWGAQHLAIPFLADPTYITSRVIAAFAAISLFPIAYVLFRRKLMPFIGAHYIADLATAILATLIPRIVD